MTLGSQIITQINEYETFITLESSLVNKSLIYHQIRDLDNKQGGVFGENIFSREYFQNNKNYIDDGDILKGQQKASRYILTSQRNKKKLITLRLEKESSKNIFSNLEDTDFFLYDIIHVSNSSLVLDTDTHSIIKVPNNVYIILNKALRKSLYFFTGNYDLLTAYVDT